MGQSSSHNVVFKASGKTNLFDKVGSVFTTNKMNTGEGRDSELMADMASHSRSIDVGDKSLVINRDYNINPSLF